MSSRTHARSLSSSSLITKDGHSITTIPSPEGRRPLLPRPQVLQSSDPLKLADKPVRRLRNNVSLACNECKAKKSRCDGFRPCSRCTDKGLECYFEHGKDRRRIRGNCDETLILTERISQYQRLFTILRTIPQGEAIRILHHLRSSPHEVSQISESGHDQVLDEALQLAQDLQQVSSSPESVHNTFASRGAGTVQSLYQSQPESSPTSHSVSQNQSPLAVSAFDPQLTNWVRQLISQDAGKVQSSTFTSLTESQSLDHSKSNTSVNSTPSSFYKESSDRDTGVLWPAYVTTDWEQATAWLNHDLDQAAHFSPPGYAPVTRESALRGSVSRWQSTAKGMDPPINLHAVDGDAHSDNDDVFENH